MNAHKFAGIGATLLGVSLPYFSTTAFSQAQPAPAAGAAAPAAAAGRGAGRGTPMVRMLSPGRDLGYRYNPDPLPIPENLKCKVTEKTPRCGVNGFAFQVGSVAQDAKGHIYVAQRSAEGPQLLEWDTNRRFVRGFAAGATNRAHGMAFDAEGNLWLADQWGNTVTKFAPDGRVLQVLGERGKEGDWDEAKGTKLLFAPLAIAFARDGSMYISQGHGRESNANAPARILHLDRNLRVLHQWFGNVNAPGKFGMAHSIVIRPDNGNLYIADRDDKRIVIYTGDGKFVKAIEMNNYVCAFMVTKNNELWVSTGGDGQIVRMDWEGNVLGAVGLGYGDGPGQFLESNFMVQDARGNLIVGDTALGRVQEMIAPAG